MIVAITGLQGSSPAVDRDKGMQNVLAKYPDIKVLVKGDGQWIREPAVKLMEDWLTAHPEIDAVFSHAEESAWGAQLAISRANRCAEGIKHFTFDGSNAGFKSVKAGTFGADGNYTPFIGDIGLRAVFYTLMKKEIPGTPGIPVRRLPARAAGFARRRAGECRRVDRPGLGRFRADARSLQVVKAQRSTHDLERGRRC